MQDYFLSIHHQITKIYITYNMINLNIGGTYEGNCKTKEYK